VSREAVEAVRLALIRDLGWYPREPTAPDYGIDLYVEGAIDDVPNGRMLGLQIKGGSSFFEERSGDSFVFRGDRRHLDYWTGHSLPVIVVLYDPDAEVALWQVVAPETVESTGVGWKLLVPAHQRLDADAVEALGALADGDEYTLRLNALRADSTWIAMLHAGGEVLLDVGEWINKTSGRGGLSLTGRPVGGGEQIERVREVFLGMRDYADALPLLFPWASFEVDEETYGEHEEQLWELEEGHYDSEEKRMIMAGSTFAEWRELRGLSGLRPYTVEAGEVALWRLGMSLNDIGRAFVALDEYLRAGSSR
jgi:hypothetical protein